MRFGVFLLVALLAGCSYFQKGGEEPVCPKVGLLAEADRVFLPSAEARIHGFKGSCSFKGQAARLELVVPFAARREADAPGVKTQELTYFISVLSPEEDILQRHAFSTHVDFDDHGIGQTEEEHSLTVPVSDPAQVSGYKVVIGFALTPDQLQYNREKNKE